MAKNTQPSKPNENSHKAKGEDLVLERGLPSNPEAERLCLGSVVLDDSKWQVLSEIISAEHYSLEVHKRIHTAMAAIKERGETINRLTLADALMKAGQLEAIGGLQYLVSLDEGLPEISDLGSYARLVLSKSGLRSLIFSSQRTLQAAMSEQGTPQEIAEAATQDFQSIQAGDARDDGGQTPIQIIESFAGGVGAFLDPSSRRRGLPTGFLRFDELTGGLHDGELIIIGARPGAGKSALALNILEHICLNPKTRKFGALFSLEMSGESLVTRLLCSMGRVDQHKFRAGYLNKDERHRLHLAINDLQDARLKIFDEPGITLATFSSKVRRLVNDEGLHFVALDFLQLMGVSRRGENRNIELGELSRGLKTLAMECQIPIIALSQLSRGSEKRPGGRPELSDLRESGNLEQDPDLVTMIFRPEMYHRDREDMKGVAELLIRKSRNGPLATVKLRFLHQYTRFENPAEDLAPDQSGRLGERDDDD